MKGSVFMAHENYVVYKHTAPNQKVYIGMTQQKPETRWKNGLGYKRHDHFWNAICKYGWDNIQHEIICEGLSKEEAEAKEIELIAKHKSNQREFGYNVDLGGNSIGKHSKETCEKISKSNKGRKPSKQTIEAMVKAHKGVSLSEEHKRKISKSLAGTYHSEESRRKMSEAKKDTGKRVAQIKDNKIIAVFRNSIEADEKTGITSSNIRRCCSGERKSAGGYEWRLV